MRARLLEETTNYFRGGDNRSEFPDIESSQLYSISTLLDPRFRKLGFHSENKADAAEKLLREMAADIEHNRTAESINDISSSQPTDDWDACMGLVPDPDIVFNTNSSQEEVTAFLSGPVIGRKSSPFTWWRNNQTKFPNLACPARRFLSAPMASIASEGEFKVAKRVVNDRYSLKPDNVTYFHCSNITCE